MAESKMERLIPDWPELFGRRWGWPRFFEEGWPQLGDRGSLRVEEFVDEGRLVVRVELPGIDPDKDVEVSVSAGMLHIRAERREETKTESRRGFRSEFHYGTYSRSLPLPAGASEKDVEATYTDGILEVRIPIGEKGQATKVPITKK